MALAKTAGLCRSRSVVFLYSHLLQETSSLSNAEVVLDQTRKDLNICSHVHMPRLNIWTFTFFCWESCLLNLIGTLRKAAQNYFCSPKLFLVVWKCPDINNRVKAFLPWGFRQTLEDKLEASETNHSSNYLLRDNTMIIF